MTNQTEQSPLRRTLHDPQEFTLTFELVPGRGGRTRELERILNLARDIAEDGRFQAVSITENAGGYPALSPEVLGSEIRAMGLDAIIHLSCKDKNRNQIESLLFSWDRQELRNLLVIAGDYPKEGFRGFPKPVFDLDTVQVLDLLTCMNNGLDLSADTAAAGKPSFAPSSFLKGVAVSPFKLTEAEQLMQYCKLHRKIDAGADFIITQLGYDGRKFEELLLYMKQNNLHVPVLGNVFVPSMVVAGLMHKGRIPGCVIGDTLYERMVNEARQPDKGKRARLQRAARLLAVQKGLGYSGAHIGGPGLSYEDIQFLLEQAEGFGADWQSCLDELSFWPEPGFYYFGKAAQGNLNSGIPSKRLPKAVVTPAYSMSRFIHDLAFEADGLLCRPMKMICLGLAQSRLEGCLERFEHVIKTALFGCQNCGDCSLGELGFLCPQSGCAKYQLNGPCGGSRDGWCEVYPDSRKCLYVKLYERLKAHGLEETVKKGFVPPRNWALNNTSSWVNFFKGIDHTGQSGKTCE